jgi:hypothetical protein
MDEKKFLTTKEVADLLALPLITIERWWHQGKIPFKIIYHYELIKKGNFHRPRTDGRILADIQPIELLEQDQIIIQPDILLKDLIPVIKKSKRNYFPVVNKESKDFMGMVCLF